MIRRFIGPILLLALLVVGDQIRIRRPDHKFRLTVEVDTPDGIRLAGNVLAVHPDRGYARGGSTQTKGDAVAVDLGSGRRLVALLAHRDERGINLDEINYAAVRAFNAAGQRAVFRQMDKVQGSVPVTGTVMPLLAVVTDAANPASMREVAPDTIGAALGPGYRLKGISVEVVPNGLWPIDFGGALGEPVTRNIAALLPWVTSSGGPAAAVEAAGLKLPPESAPVAIFTRD
jgi:hypothetical protein